jgi:hypothetical protein
MKEGEKAMEFTIDNLETLSIKNNWCSWCVNVFVSDQSGEWNSCGTGLLSFYGKKKQQSTLSKLASIKELKNDSESKHRPNYSMGVKHVYNASQVKQKLSQ